MKKCYLRVMLLVENIELDLSERTNVVQSQLDIARAIRVLLPAVAKEYFLTIPNPNNTDHVKDVINELKLSSTLELVHPNYWYSTIANNIKSYLSKRFTRWDIVRWFYASGVYDFVNYGDYRIQYFNNHHGNHRVGIEIEQPQHATNPDAITDPFFVSDTITPDMQDDVVTIEELAGSTRLKYKFSNDNHILSMDRPKNGKKITTIGKHEFSPSAYDEQ